MSIRIGFIGTGGIALHHMKELLKIGQARVASVYDMNRDNAVQAQQLTGAEVAESADEVLNPRNIDAVYICTPPFARDNLEETAVRRNIPMFIEKPLGLDMETVRRKESIIGESGAIHAVGYCLRYYDTVQQAKAYLSGRRAHLIHAYRFGGYHPAKWWHRLDLSGGHLVDAVTHQVDMIRYLAGEFHEVNARFSRSALDQVMPEGTIYDAGAVTFTMNSGTTGTITESCLSIHHSASEIQFFGADFFVQISNNGAALTIIDKDRHTVVYSKVAPYYEQSKAFLEAVASGSRAGILSDYSDARRTLAFTLAANQSSAEGRGIVLQP